MTHTADLAELPENIPAFLSDLPVPMPESRNLSIAIVGAGRIVRYAHLPAYRKAGFDVRGIFDRVSGQAQALADEFGIGRVYGELGELLDDSSVHIVDIGIPPDQQPAVALEAIAAGKHVLCQKPLAWTYAEAELIVDAAHAAGVKLAVNQQTRWTPAVRAAKKLLEHHLLGIPTRCAFDFAFFETSSWWDAAEEPALRADCVHMVDVVRLLLGQPQLVRAMMWREEGQSAAGETLVEILLSYGPTSAATITSNTRCWLREVRADFELQGTGGIARASLAEWTHYPLPVADRFTLVLRDDPDTLYRPSFQISHIPDAFIATMAELMIAVERDEEPSTSGRDNLSTLVLLDAVSRSATGGGAETVPGTSEPPLLDKSHPKIPPSP